MSNVVDADVCGNNGVPSVLGSQLIHQRRHHLQWDGGKEGVEHQLVLMELDVVELDGVPMLARL
jgi:hypothetical protein